VININKGDDQQSGNKGIINQRFKGQAVLKKNPYRKNATHKFDYGIAKRDGRLAMATFPSKQGIA
jgi:hypothetical protein